MLQCDRRTFQLAERACKSEFKSVSPFSTLRAGTAIYTPSSCQTRMRGAGIAPPVMESVLRVYALETEKPIALQSYVAKF